MSDSSLENLILTCTSNEIGARTTPSTTTTTTTIESCNKIKNTNSNNFDDNNKASFVDINARRKDQINKSSNTRSLNQNQYLNGQISKLSPSKTNTSSLNNNYNDNNNSMNSNEIITINSTREESLKKDQNEPQLNELDKYKSNLEAKEIKVIYFFYMFNYMLIYKSKKGKKKFTRV